MAIDNSQAAGGAQGQAGAGGQGSGGAGDPNNQNQGGNDQDDDDDDEDPVVTMKQSQLDALVQKSKDKAIRSALRKQGGQPQQPSQQQPAGQSQTQATPNGGGQGGIDYNALAQALVQAGVVQPQSQQPKGGNQDASILVAKAEAKSDVRESLRDEGVTKEKLNKAFRLMEFDTLVDEEGELDERKFRKQLKEVRTEFPELFGKAPAQAPKKGGVVGGGNGQQQKGGQESAVHSAIRSRLFGSPQ